jgi:NADH-quinone oxidoreductase subunit H
MISYELALTIAVLGVLVTAGTFYLPDVVGYQQAHHWNVIPQIIGFFVFLIASFAETNRLPFDLPEAESELIAGFHTEYSAMRFALFFQAEYTNMAALAALGITLYFGGWSFPGSTAVIGFFQAHLSPLLATIATVALGVGVLVAKIALWMALFVWVRWTFPRFRYDQLMRLGWKVLLPLAILNLLLVSAMTLAGWL